MPQTLLFTFLVAAAVLLNSGAEARGSGARSSMERCVQRVLTGLARARAPEAQVGRAVVSNCDGPLRANLAAAIRSGDAAMCTVESCIQMARERAAEEATAAYRQYGRR
jgi:hypothetical protein